ncbi:MAG: TRAP transporter permease [Lachnospirales bacterium]
MNNQNTVKTNTNTEKSGSKFSNMPMWQYAAVAILSCILVSFQLYIALVKPFDKWIQVPFHLCIGLSIIFLANPLANKCNSKGTKTLAWLYDIILQIGIIYVIAYFFTHLSYLQNRIYNVDVMTTADLICSYTLLFLVMEAVRRTMGMALFAFISFFIAYAFLGQNIPGIFQFRGMSWQGFGEVMIMDVNGILGSPLTSSVNTLFYFLLFGAFFSICGGGQVLIDLGMKLSDKTAGGPAKAAVVSSGLMGMISGSAVANVTSTGVMTIPLMKKAGYKSEEAGAIEAVASTGGQIMPPIMGVGAFIMAEMIGVSYTHIAIAAIIPALCYYGSVLLLVHFLAKKKISLKVSKDDVKVITDPIAPRLYQLIPIVTLVALIFMGSSLTTSALIATFLAIAVSMVKKETRLSIKDFINTIMEGASQGASIAVPTAACGIMIGIVVQSGVANKLTKLISAAGGSSIALALILTALGCMLLGMALPTVAAYLIANILFCSTLISLGIPILSANMFIFYFGVIAQITPPVCLASFTAAGIADASAWKTGWLAFLYALVAFLVPYVFVFEPALLMDGSAGEIIINVLILSYGIMFLAGAISGYLIKVIDKMYLRVALIIIAICVVLPIYAITIPAGIIGAIILVYLFLQKQKTVKIA